MRIGTKESTVRNMYGNKNKVMGNHFEAELCELLADAGWWAHNMAQNETGQPADVIAVKNDVAVLIDCKVCSNDTFPLTRIEANQEGAMTLWEERGNNYCFFAMKLTDETIYMVEFDRLMMLQLHGEKSIRPEDFVEYPTLEEWLEDMNCV